MFDPALQLTTSSPEQALANRILDHEKRIADALAPLDPHTATYAWIDTLRAIEECINLMHVDWGDDAFEHTLMTLPVAGLLANPANLLSVRQRFIERFSEPFANRFTNLLVQSSAISASFAGHHLVEVAAGFQTVATMIGYFQSRRRHFVALLHRLPSACQGRQLVAPLDTLNIFLPIVELEAIQMMGVQESLLIKRAGAKLGLPDPASLDLAMLDNFFLEPERSRIDEMPITPAGMAMLAMREELKADRLFSAAELRNDILRIEAAYAEFDLSATDFAPAAALGRRLSAEFVDRDFWVVIPPEDLDRLMRELGVGPALKAALVFRGNTQLLALATYAPLILIDGVYRSTVTLLSRFLYSWRARSLDRIKRFQIRAGFIFEKAVAAELERQGFAVQTITRVSRREFDVVTLRDGRIWNVQCKNNFTDLERIDTDASRFARYNAGLVKAYERALNKERDREHLLQVKLAVDEIEHMVISRFPVVTDNRRIVPFSRISRFAQIADDLLSRQSHG